MLSWPLLAQTPPEREEQQIPPLRTSITVIEKIAAEAPVSIEVLGQRSIDRIPGVNLDDRLRMVPGFTLFRRSSGIVANPTTQGVSLRGLGSTGASRTLVLWDGVPINDPFGGWIYWTRVAPEELDRVEVSRSAATSVFGDKAMGGAVTLFSRPAERYRLNAGWESGNRDTTGLSAGFSHLWTHVATSAQVRTFTTDGYFIVPQRLRGTVDTQAGVRFVAGDLKLDFFGVRDRLFLKLDMLAEDRENGTVLQTNSTSLGSLSANYLREQGQDTFSVLGYHTRGEFRAAFSSIGAGRNTETLAYRQTVPWEAFGGAALWRRSKSHWNLVAGADVQRVEGVSTDKLLPSVLRVGGGTQLQYGAFVQTDFSAGPARLFLGAREQATGANENFFSPSAGFVIGRGRLRGRGSVYRAFRAPTLNELFREFRAGNAVTQANAALVPERLFGTEVGFDVTGETSRLSITMFRNSLEDLIANVTLSSTPALIVRQRRNIVDALVRGVEIDARHRWRHWQGEASYLFADSRIATRERVAQIPKHQGSAQLIFERGGTLAAAGLRTTGLQFEDDRNTLLLPGFATVHLSVRQRLVRSLSAMLSIENLIDREYLTGFTPLAQIGPPRLWRAGLRWDGRVR